MKRSLALLLCCTCLLVPFLGMYGCSGDKPVVGIIQFGPHASLNNCYTGICAALEAAGVTEATYEIAYCNSNFTAETAYSQANMLVNRGARVIIAIATPAAIQAAVAAEAAGVPVVYCAVTDATTVANFTNLTGTSDVPDFSAQLALISAFYGGRTDLKIGTLCSTEEPSDPAQLAALRAAAQRYPGMQIIDQTVADITTIDTALDSLITGKEVDCLVNLLDNTIVGKLSNILTHAEAAGIPVFGSEIEQVRAGCLASASIDYVTVGRLCGEQAAAILQGTPLADVAPRTMENETFLCYNPAVLERFPALTLPSLPGLEAVATAA